MPNTDNAEYDAKVLRRVQAAIAAGSTEFMDVLAQCQGADPRLVRNFYEAELKRQNPDKNFDARPSYREISGLLPWDLPAADPGRGQWWFSLDTLDYLSDKIAGTIEAAKPDETRVLCLGTPTLAVRLCSMGFRTCVLDADAHVLEAVAKAASAKPLECRRYDVTDTLPQDLHDGFDVVVLDPPWYDDEIRAFLARATSALKANGHAFVALPPQLTRPTAEQERERLIDTLVGTGAKLRSIETCALQYLVPRFEEAALHSVNGFTGRPWRHGDLLHFRKPNVKCEFPLPDPLSPAYPVEVFTRRPAEFRVFLANRGSDKRRTIIEPVAGYSENVSRRAHGTSPDIWTTEKSGALVQDKKEASLVLTLWQQGLSQEQTAAALSTDHDYETKDASSVVEKYEEFLNLWSRYAQGSPRRDAAVIAKNHNEQLSEWATKPSRREHQGNADGFRLEFQRDRDRILWSSGLRKLANKTQLFPVESDDQLRQRLTHSIEVMQLASTIGASFGLDEDLIQAGALAHDIGHTPFGHAGEHALDRLLTRISPNLPGFNHYEHGVDVVRWLEGPYQSQGVGGHLGLNLTPEVAECIFKHTFCQSGGVFSHDDLRRNSKNAGFIIEGYCHLEGQTVRIADKVSYLISDLEDGIRLGVISERELHKCRLFHRPPIDFPTKVSRERLHSHFVDQRRNIIRVLMEDIILETGRRLARRGSGLINAVRQASEYTVDHSTELKSDVNEVWMVIQAGRLHKDPRVVAANMRAARIVSELTVLFTLFPNFIEDSFQREYQRLNGSPYLEFYLRAGKRVELPRELLSFLPIDLLIGQKVEPGNGKIVDMTDLIRAKDFVAGLTDTRARQLHKNYVQSRSGLE